MALFHVTARNLHVSKDSCSDFVEEPRFLKLCDIGFGARFRSAAAPLRFKSTYVYLLRILETVTTALSRGVVFHADARGADALPPRPSHSISTNPCSASGWLILGDFGNPSEDPDKNNSSARKSTSDRPCNAAPRCSDCKSTADQNRKSAGARDTGKRLRVGWSAEWAGHFPEYSRSVSRRVTCTSRAIYGLPTGAMGPLLAILEHGASHYSKNVWSACHKTSYSGSMRPPPYPVLLAGLFMPSASLKPPKRTQVTPHAMR